MNKRTRRTVCCALGAVAIACAAACLSACSSGGWDIAADAASSVTAQTIETDGGLELRISGSGRMRTLRKARRRGTTGRRT